MKKVLFILLLILTSVDVLSQSLILNTNHRRRYDEIHLELWLKSSQTYSPNILGAKLYLNFDTNSVSIINQISNSTDSISANIDQINPIIDIISPINSSNGLSVPKLILNAEKNNEISIEFNKLNQLSQGFRPESTGKGTLIALLKFKIKDSVNYNSMTGMKWNIDSSQVFDLSSNNIAEYITFQSDSSFKVLGITLLSPVLNNSVIDRDKDYASLTTSYKGKGYPIYFERSINPSRYTIPTKQQALIDKDLAYSFEYNLGDSIWFEFGRFIESEEASSTINNNNLYYTGNINNPNTTTSYIVTSYKGSKLNLDNFRNPLRFILNKEPSYKVRFDKIFLRLRQLQGSFGTNLLNWNTDSIYSDIKGPMTAARLFFLQLNGLNEYLKSDDNLSNSTQLTVEAWVNLNLIKKQGSNPGIVVSSGGPDATLINGSKEGSWMLYLKDGKYPAFRVREIENRGKNGYLADLVSDFPLTEISSDSLYTHSFDLNWNHIAATVNNNIVTLYVNGIIVDKFINDSALDIRMLTTNHPIWIGLNPNNNIDANNILAAGIKAIRLWKVALTQKEVKQFANGLFQANNTVQFDDIRRGLILDYSFNGELLDRADDIKYQQGIQNILYFKSNTINNNIPIFKPDFPHLKITAPIKNSGLSNIAKSHYELSWVSYEIGNIGKLNSHDLELEYSIDGGNSWVGIKDTLNKSQIGINAPDIEKLSIIWEPFLNNDQGASLRNISPYSKKVLLKASGTLENLQKEAYYISDTVIIAPYFSVYKDKNTILRTDQHNTINLIENRNMFEIWIKPYRFATAAEKSIPLIAKVDSVSGKEYFSLKLLNNGQLKFSILDSKDSMRNAYSNINYPIIEANSIALDSPWTHIAVYFDMNQGNNNSFIRFYIDGVPQNDSSITYQLGSSFEPSINLKLPTYLCSYPQDSKQKLGEFYGELREFRYWNDLPTSIDANNENDELTKFIQGALSNRTGKFKEEIKKHLKYALSFNGGTGVYNEIRLLNSDDFDDFYVKYSNEAKFVPTQPYIKVIEPLFRQQTNNKNEKLKVRWVGFDYSSLISDISFGSPSNPPILEYSLLGGGGNETQPYKYVGSPYWSGNKVTSISLPSNTDFKFYGLQDSSIYAVNLNVSQANPDKNNDNKYNDQGALPATLTNARLRLLLKYRIFDEIKSIASESSLFTITPGSNFTLRLVPEGYYDGNSYPIRQIGSDYDNGGVKIKIFEDNNGKIGKLIDSADSFFQYSEVNPKNLNAGNNKFANIDFVFENLNKTAYWVLAEKRNYLPVLSRFAAPYIFEGDNPDTWRIESGWDFTSWNGEKLNLLSSSKIDPWIGRYFTAYGNSSSEIGDTATLTTPLKYTTGLYRDTESGLSLMVAGDVVKDNIINEKDYQALRKSEGTYRSAMDLTGDNYINADDRVLINENMKRSISFDTAAIPVSIIYNEQAGSANKEAQSKYQLLANSAIRTYLDYEIKNNSLFVDISISSIGSPFYLGSSTIAFTFDTSIVKYKAFTTKSEVPFGQSKYGYLNMRSAPELNAENGVKNLRTVEIEFDKTLGQIGSLLDNKKTYIATFRFDILKNKTIIMKWHPSTSIHSTEAKLKVEDVLQDSIKPIYQYSMNLLTPNGGEEFRPKTPIDIKWSSNGTSLINLEYSYNYGYNWIRINDTPINVSNNKYSWSAPTVYSTSYLIRAIDNDSGEQIDISDSAFSVVSGFAYFLKPAANDEVYIGGTKSQIYWASGGLTNITLLFSSNSGDKWSVISNKVDATKNEIMWTIPKINTKTAIIRMVDNLTKDTIIDSDLFKIMSGRIIFQRPKSLEKVYTNHDYSIRWSNDGVDTFDLQISYDNGKNWEYLKVNIQAKNQLYKWLVPNKETDNAILRAIWKGDFSLEFGQSETFVITTLNSIDTEELKNLGISIYPNPIIDYLNIVNKSDFIFSKIKIFDLAGKLIFQNLINAESDKIDLTTLENGIYIIELSSNNKNLKVKIMKQ
ncbi:MAG TPA: T9SS type A sorting domain-containing protein [Candidatus Kapabacteria bacterium]|nr:T9SS type A sorting domain-containing protein [Candidatus Kapabacteria bacterium]